MNFKDFYYQLKEETINDIKGNVDSLRKDNALPVVSTYESINKRGTITFKSTAITSPGRYGIYEWTQRVRPHKKPVSSSSLKAFREIYDGDVDVACDCPDFKFGGYQYIATKGDFKLGKAQTISPDIRNPNLEGTTCRHLANVLTVVKTNLPSAYKDFKKL
jgi:hypothetical protein